MAGLNMLAARRIRTVLLVLAVLLATPARAAEPVPIAVSYFDNTSARPDLAPLEKGLADMLITDLANADDIVVVERARLEAVLAELRLQRTPWADPATAQRLGKGLGAAYLLTGAYLVGGASLRIDVRVVDVATGAVVLTVKQEGKTDDFFAIERKLAESLLAGLGAKLSLLAHKRIGAGGTGDLDALNHYGRSLDARDRGDARAERDALAKALAADPEFGRVKARLATLEGKVAALERAGGRILSPAGAADHLHNARIEREQGRHDAALAAARAAASADPDLLDVWLLVRQMGAAASVPRPLTALSAELRRAIDAYLAAQAALLHAAVRDAKSPVRVAAAVLLFDLVAPELPARTLTRFEMALDAADVIDAAHARGDLRDLVIDPAALSERVRALRAREVGPTRVEQARRRGEAAFINRAGFNTIYSDWELAVALYEQPSDLSLTIARDDRHPHWRQPPPPPGAHKIDMARYLARVPETRRPALEAAIARRDGFAYQITRDVGDFVPLETDPPAPGTLGQPIAIPASSLRCLPHPQALTATRCVTYLRVPFAVLPPGLYRLTLDYRDAEGRPVHVTVPAWAREVELVDSLGPRADRGSTRHDQALHRLADLPGQQGPEVARELAAKLIGKRPLAPVFAIMAVTFFRNHFPGSEKSPTRYIERLAWDVDFALRDGAPAIAPPIAPDDFAEWQRYRDLIIARGWSLRADVDSDTDFLPLPDLSPGEHVICVATTRANGTRSAEPECTIIEVPPP